MDPTGSEARGTPTLGSVLVLLLIGLAALGYDNLTAPPTIAAAPQSQTAQAAQTASGSSLKSGAPQNCTDAIKAAFGLEKGPPAQAFDQGSSGTLDACFGAVLKQGKQPSQNPADYQCVGRSGTVRLGASVTTLTSPDFSVGKGYCQMRVCKQSSPNGGALCAPARLYGSGDTVPLSLNFTPSASDNTPPDTGASPVPPTITPPSTSPVSGSGQISGAFGAGAQPIQYTPYTLDTNSSANSLAGVTVSPTAPGDLGSVAPGDAGPSVLPNTTDFTKNASALSWQSPEGAATIPNVSPDGHTTLGGDTTLCYPYGCAPNTFSENNGTQADWNQGYAVAVSPANVPQDQNGDQQAWNNGYAEAVSPYNMPKELNGSQQDWNNGFAQAPAQTWHDAMYKNTWGLLGWPDYPPADYPSAPALDKSVSDTASAANGGWVAPSEQNGTQEDWNKGFAQATSPTSADAGTKTPDTSTTPPSNPADAAGQGTGKAVEGTPEQPATPDTPNQRRTLPDILGSDRTNNPGRITAADQSSPNGSNNKTDGNGNPVTPPTNDKNNNNNGGLPSGLGSFLSGLAQGFAKAMLQQPQQPAAQPAQACSTDPNVYAQQQAQYQAALQQYNYQLQQAQYQQQLNAYYGNGSALAPALPAQPSPCTPSSGQQCSTQAPQPAAASCSGGWQPVYSGSCIVNWSCPNVDLGPSLSCSPSTADVGATITLNYSCAQGTASGSGFTTTSASGTATTTLASPPAGANTATYALTCTQGTQTAGAQCSVQVVDAHIVLVANPKVIAAGGTSQIGWTTTGMQSCVISSPQQSDFTARNASNTSVSGSAVSSPIQTSARFNLNCVTLGGTAKSATIVVGVPGAGEPAQTSSITANSTADGGTLNHGDNVTITWQSDSEPSGANVALWLVDASSGQTTALIAGTQALSGTYAWTVPAANSTCPSDGSLNVCGANLVAGHQYMIEADVYTPSNAYVGDGAPPSGPVQPTYGDYADGQPFTVGN